ncbi:hypothetical protein, partial [Xanthomonas oryzae]|uniref:hypothetical protein n=1 Tax=Xanthomonas oryzae TaxID=347 RepID=UPI000949E325
MQGFICVFGVLELPLIGKLRTGFWQFWPLSTRRPAAEELPAHGLRRSRTGNQIYLHNPRVP